MPSILANALLCLVAFACAKNFPKDQRGAGVFAVSALFLNWMAYAAAAEPVYNFLGIDLAPAYLINHTLGYYAVSHEAVWAWTDAITATVIVLVCYRHLWAYALWGIYTLELYAHYVRYGSYISENAYSSILDLLFMAMIAVFILIGGKGSFGYVSRIAVDMHVRGIRGFRGALQRERAQRAKKINGS